MAAFLAGCSGGPVVSHVGEMRSVLREGQTQPRIDLAEFIRRPHGYAVGAMAGLDGEVTVADGDVWITRVAGGEPGTTGPRPRAGDRATLLIGAHVPSWRAVPLPAAGGKELEAAIAKAAAGSGIDIRRPFPFRIEGDFSALDLHVVNGFCPHAEENAVARDQSWTMTGPPPARVSIVGFYADNSEGVLTHHGSSIHAHALVDTQRGVLTGHVDAMAVKQGASLLLPTSRRD